MRITRFGAVLVFPTTCQIQMNAVLVQHAVDGLIDDVINREGFMVKGRHGRENHATCLRHGKHVV